LCRSCTGELAYLLQCFTLLSLYVTSAGQVHSDVDGNTVRRLRMARHCAAVPRVRPRHGSDDRHVGPGRLRLHVLHVPRLLLPLHLLRRESGALTISYGVQPTPPRTIFHPPDRNPPERTPPPGNTLFPRLSLVFSGGCSGGFYPGVIDC